MSPPRESAGSGHCCLVSWPYRTEQDIGNEIKWTARGAVPGCSRRSRLAFRRLGSDRSPGLLIHRWPIHFVSIHSGMPWDVPL